MQNHIPRLLLSATGSDSGKTTMMLALLSAFQKSGVVVQSYKSGPDYIDPMFHEAVTHRPAYHTDPFFLQPDAMRKLVAATAQQADFRSQCLHRFAVAGNTSGIGCKPAENGAFCRCDLQRLFAVRATQSHCWISVESSSQRHGSLLSIHY